MAGQVGHVHELLSELETVTFTALTSKREPCRDSQESVHCLGEKLWILKYSPVTGLLVLVKLFCLQLLQVESL